MPMQNIDSFGLVAQVQGVVEAYIRLRDEKSKLEEKIFQLNQDLSRMQKSMADLVKENDALKAATK
jgi:regulator of replication initiation timing